MTSTFSILTFLLMFTVMCSDPGIESRKGLNKIPSQVSDVENHNPENGHMLVSHSYRLNTQDSEELPDLRTLGFNRYEEQMIKKGFSQRLTGSTDPVNESTSENIHLIL